ncbi:CRISPR-associated helicase Cas3' [Leptothrix sp. BB-4]
MPLHHQPPTSPHDPPMAPWGKLTRDPVSGAVVAMHPLLDHLVDVSSCFVALARCQAIRRSLEQAAGRRLAETDLKRLAALAFLHDIGKATAAFQGKWWREHEVPPHWPAHGGHGSDGWALFAEPDDSGVARIAAALPQAAMAGWGDATFDLLRASISHHGRPVSDEPTAGPLAWQPVQLDGEVLYDPLGTVKTIGQAMTRLFPLAFAPYPMPLPDRPAFVHLYAGLVQLADWLASDTRPDFFPYTSPDEDRALSAPVRAAQAVRAIGLQVQAWRTPLQTRPPTFEAAFGMSAPRPLQSAMADLPVGPVVVLEAETGSGKTEAALWRFLTMFRAGEVDSLYFALPTRTAATQIHARVCEVVRRVWPAGTPVTVRALPGYVAADEAHPQRLVGYEVLWSDRPDDLTAERRWAAESPKRHLAATIAVGTIDQALLGALRVRHAHLRQSLLARSLLVVDEVHASDAYMTELLVRLLAAHGATGGPALLLSATLGAVARSRYLQIERARHRQQRPTLAQALAVPYPSIGHRPYGGEPLVVGVGGAGQGKTVHWQTLDAIDDPVRIAALAVDAARRGARVLVVRNTVPAAVATLRAVETLMASQQAGQPDLLFRVAGVSTPHHSRYSREDRPLLDLALERGMGKVRQPIAGLIVIGTQTLEQSLDIDADLLITDLCPMDVLLQRVGRLHRHVRPSQADPVDPRPAGFEQPAAWVLTPAAHDLAPLLQGARHGLGPIRRPDGLDGVYIDLRMLEATRRLIDARPSRDIPADNRELVERATHPEALDAISAELGAAWQAFGQEVDGRTGAHASLARLQALPYDRPYADLMFPDAEEALATRLGAHDRLIVLPQAVTGPFGTPVRELTLRHHQAPGLAVGAEAAGVTPLVDEPGFTFTLGDLRFRYDRMGLTRTAVAVAGDPC